MALYGISFVITYVAWNTALNCGASSDAANHTLRWVKDGTSNVPANAPSEVDAVNLPGLYKLTLTAAEAQATFGALGGKSSTPNVSIMPVMVPFEDILTATRTENAVWDAVGASHAVAGSTGAEMALASGAAPASAIAAIVEPATRRRVVDRTEVF